MPFYNKMMTMMMMSY